MPPGVGLKQVTVAEEFEKNPDLTQEDLNELRQWVMTQKHLPEVSDFMLIQSLHSCYYDLALAKETIEHFYTMGSNAPEFFADRDITRPDLAKMAQVVTITRLPLLDPLGYAIYYYGLSDTDPTKFDYAVGCKLGFMIHEAHVIEDGTSLGFHMIFDMKGTTLRHILQIGLTSLKKMLLFMEKALIMRRKTVHFVNAPSWVDKLLLLMKPWLSKETAASIQCHSRGNMETLYTFFPKQCLPSNLGGDLKPASEYHAAGCRDLERFLEYFSEEEKLKVDESKRAKKANRLVTAIRRLDFD